MDKDNIGSILIGFGVGVVIGGICGLLFAPLSGKDTRKWVEDKVDEVKSNLPLIKDIGKVHKK
jgi:gas vesicle protein